MPTDWDNFVNFLNSSPVTSLQVREYTRRDPILSKVVSFCEMGWPCAPSTDVQIVPCRIRRDELSLQNGCLLWGSWVIDPSGLRGKLLQELNSGHTGASRMNELACSYIWWPRLDSEELSRSCSECLSQRSAPARAELHHWEWPC